MASSKENTAAGFLKQGSILAVASIMVRVIGMIYRIPMANIIGDEGNGIYSAAYEIYNILLIISSYGMPMAVSKMVSARCAQKRYKNAYKIFRYSMLVSVITGGSAALFVYFGAEWLEHQFFSKYNGVAIPLKILAPTIFIVAVMGTLRGLFQGRKTMLPTAVSQIFEQVVNAFVSVGAAYFFMRAHSASDKLPAWGAAGGTLGTCAGALVALIILVFIYLVYKPIMVKQETRDKTSKTISAAQSFRIIAITVIPIILSQTVYQLSGIVDVTLFNGVMGMKGISDKAVSTMQGIYSTKYRLLVNVPVAISSAIASSMIPSLVTSFAAGGTDIVKNKVSMAVKFNMIIAFPSAMGLSVLAEPVIRLLFPSSDYKTGGLMLITGSVCIIFYALSTVTNGVLQSIDKMGLPVIHSLVSLVIHIGIVAGLLIWTDMGVFALVAGNVTYPVLVCVLNGISLKKYLGYKQEVTTTFCVPLIASFIMGVATLAVYYVFFILTHKIYVAIVPAVMAAVFIYFALVLKLQGLKRQELYEFPFGRRMSVLADKLHLLKRQ
ncbi:MAG: polysaccharide biosynthesis protein [Lachnospiraceae bacterium]